jgi:hypothetical protein
LLTSPATFDAPAPPRPDAVAIRGRTDRNSTGPQDVPVGVAGMATGHVTGAGGRIFGVRGTATGSIKDPSALLVGVEGRTFTPSGAAIGVRGVSDSKEGIGVRGLTTATSGVNYGVFGSSESPDGVGVRAIGARFAISASAEGPGATVISANTGSADGVSVIAVSPTRGVWGVAHASEAGASGLLGEARGARATFAG